MFVVNHRKIFYSISGVLVALSIAALAIWHLNLGIDFTGGSLVEVAYSGLTATSTPAMATTTAPTLSQVNSELSALRLGDFSARPSGANDYIIRMKALSAQEHTSVIATLSQNGALAMTEKNFDSIGPTLGREAANKSILSIVLVLIAIMLFITFAFRQVSRPVSSWKYGLIAIVDLIHNIIIPIGIFSVLGHFFGTEIDTLFITALLVILGFSIHDTIVVFDRVRENLRINRSAKKTFAEIVGESINQTFARSINTSLTVLFALLVLYIVGAASTQTFILALIIGIICGTYSSIFIGSPLLVTLEQWQNRTVAKTSKK